MKQITVLGSLLLMLALSAPAQSARIKDLAKVQGVRSNQLMGYGLVVGLPGTGEKNNAFTEQTFRTMLNNFGIKVPDTLKRKIKDVAPVAVHADLPAFSKPGQTIDITVSAMAKPRVCAAVLCCKPSSRGLMVVSMRWRRVLWWLAV